MPGSVCSRRVWDSDVAGTPSSRIVRLSMYPDFLPKTTWISRMKSATGERLFGLKMLYGVAAEKGQRFFDRVLSPGIEDVVVQAMGGVEELLVLGVDPLLPTTLQRRFLQRSEMFKWLL